MTDSHNSFLFSSDLSRLQRMRNLASLHPRLLNFLRITVQKLQCFLPIFKISCPQFCPFQDLMDAENVNRLFQTVSLPSVFATSFIFQFYQYFDTILVNIKLIQFKKTTAHLTLCTLRLFGHFFSEDLNLWIIELISKLLCALKYQWSDS